MLRGAALTYTSRANYRARLTITHPVPDIFTLFVICTPASFKLRLLSSLPFSFIYQRYGTQKHKKRQLEISPLGLFYSPTSQSALMTPGSGPPNQALPTQPTLFHAYIFLKDGRTVNVARPHTERQRNTRQQQQQQPTESWKGVRPS